MWSSWPTSCTTSRTRTGSFPNAPASPARLLVFKDHKVEGPLAQQRIALLDSAANAPYGVPCLYRYNTPAEWDRWKQRHALEIEAELRSVRLYPFPYHLIFTGKLQYLAVFRVPARGG